MLRRYAPLLVVLALITLVVTACVVRTGPSRGRPGYRSAPNEKHKKWKEPKKHKKHNGKHKGHDH
ncbi:MAG TPA: hypothetical protein VM513_10920 [Kofleriaceae bacterium]|jgi:hypothetical protein|nr:hypothetical protein [Kofleriaceae bacterium]